MDKDFEKHIYIDEDEEEYNNGLPDCFGSYTPGNEQCEFLCEFRDACMSLTPKSFIEGDEE